MNQSQSQLNYISDFQTTFGKNPIAAIKQLTKLEQHILETILYIQYKHGNAWPSQGFIAKTVRCSREYVNRSIAKFVSLKLLNKKWEAWTTCDYSIGSLLNSNGIIVLLKPYIKSLKYFYKRITLPLSMLKSPRNYAGPYRAHHTTSTPISDLSISYRATKLLKRERAGGGAGAVVPASSNVQENGKGDQEFLALCDDLLRRSEARDLENDMQLVTKRHGLEDGLEESTQVVTKRHGIGRSELSAQQKKRRDKVMSGDECYYYNKNKLTLKGRIEFSCFQDPIIREAFDALNDRIHSDIYDPTKWLYAFCKRVCLERQLPIDLELKKKLYNSMGDVGLQDIWEPATNEEIWAHGKKAATGSGESNGKANGYRNIKHNSQNQAYKPEEKTSKREGWSSHLRKDDVVITTFLTPEQVEANVKVLEAAPMHKGINFRQMFAKELIEGETIRTTEREQREKEKAMKRYGLDVNGLPLDGVNSPKSETESNTINEKGLGNTDGREREESFGRIDPGHALRSATGRSAGGVAPDSAEPPEGGGSWVGSGKGDYSGAYGRIHSQRQGELF